MKFKRMFMVKDKRSSKDMLVFYLTSEGYEMVAVEDRAEDRVEDRYDDFVQYQSISYT